MPIAIIKGQLVARCTSFAILCSLTDAVTRSIHTSLTHSARSLVGRLNLICVDAVINGIVIATGNTPISVFYDFFALKLDFSLLIEIRLQLLVGNLENKFLKRYHISTTSGYMGVVEVLSRCGVDSHN